MYGLRRTHTARRRDDREVRGHFRCFSIRFVFRAAAHARALYWATYYRAMMNTGRRPAYGTLAPRDYVTVGGDLSPETRVRIIRWRRGGGLFGIYDDYYYYFFFFPSYFRTYMRVLEGKVAGFVNEIERSTTGYRGEGSLSTVRCILSRTDIIPRARGRSSLSVCARVCPFVSLLVVRRARAYIFFPYLSREYIFFPLSLSLPDWFCDIAFFFLFYRNWNRYRRTYRAVYNTRSSPPLTLSLFAHMRTRVYNTNHVSRLACYDLCPRY